MFGKLDDPATQRNRCSLGYIADPIVREVRASQDQIALVELADEVADEIATARRDDEMQLVFWMKVPAHSAERISVRPCRERLAWSYLDDFQIGFHLLPPVSAEAAHFSLRPHLWTAHCQGV